VLKAEAHALEVYFKSHSDYVFEDFEVFFHVHELEEVILFLEEIGKVDV
jgi:hypothetical protein